MPSRHHEKSYTRINIVACVELFLLLVDSLRAPVHIHSISVDSLETHIIFIVYRYALEGGGGVYEPSSDGRVLKILLPGTVLVLEYTVKCKCPRETSFSIYG